MSDNPLPVMLQIPWLVLSLALTTVAVVFYDMSQKDFDKLQCIQNRAARIVCVVG